MTLVEGRVTPLSSICRELSLGCARQGATCRAAVGTTQRRNTGKVSVCRSQLGEAADSPLPYRQSLTLVKATRNVRAAFRGAASDEESHFSTSTRSALGHHSPGLGDRPSSSVSGRPPQCQLPSAAAASRGPRQGDAPGKAQASRVATANGTPTPRRSAASAQPAAGRRPGGAQEAAVWDPVSAAALTADAARALELFVQLRNEGHPAPSHQVYSRLFHVCAQTKRWKQALALADDAAAAGVSLSGYAVNCFLSAMTKVPNPQTLARGLQAYAAHPKPDTVTFNTMLKGASVWPMPAEARAALVKRLRTEMEAAGAPPSTATLGALVAAYAALGDADSAVSAWTDLRAGGVRPDPQAWAALFAACRDGGQPDLAMSLFDAMKGAGLRPVRHHFNILIDAAAKAQQPERALAMVEDMRAAGFDPDEITFNSILRARVSADGVRGGFSLIEEMGIAGVRAGAVTWTLLIDAAAEASDAESALRAFELMRASGLHPDVVSWTAVIKAHAARLDVAGAVALYRAMCAEASGAGLAPGAPRGPAPNLSTYLTLLKAAVAAGEGSVAEEVYGDMRSARVQPNNEMFRMLLSAWADRATASEGAAAAPPSWLLRLAGSGEAGVSAPTGAGSQSQAAAPGPGPGPGLIDLHNLSAIEARAVVLCALRDFRDRGASFAAAAAEATEEAWAASSAFGSRGPRGAGAAAAAAAAAASAVSQGLTVITGKGANSQGGVSVVRQEVMKLLKELNLAVEELPDGNAGRLFVSGDQLLTWVAQKNPSGPPPSPAVAAGAPTVATAAAAGPWAGSVAGAGAGAGSVPPPSAAGLGAGGSAPVASSGAGAPAVRNSTTGAGLEGAAPRAAGVRRPARNAGGGAREAPGPGSRGEERSTPRATR